MNNHIYEIRTLYDDQIGEYLDSIVGTIISVQIEDYQSKLRKVKVVYKKTNVNWVWSEDFTNLPFDKPVLVVYHYENQYISGRFSPPNSFDGQIYFENFFVDSIGARAYNLSDLKKWCSIC